MILVRFITNLATGVLTALGAVLLLATLIGSLIGLFGLVGLATVAVWPDLVITTHPPGQHVAAGVLTLSVLALFGTLLLAGWNISKWIYSCWQKASNRTTT